jgi:DNA invertase Pin-like site-specific DNA recombinase
MLGKLAPGDVVTVTRIDRLARSNFLTCSASSSASWTPRRSFDHSSSLGPTRTPAPGRLMLAVLGGLADVERDLIRWHDFRSGLHHHRLPRHHRGN